jgi:AraC-like DNA-binding protein
MFSQSERIDGFRETFGRNMFQLDITPLTKEEPLDIQMALRLLPSVRIADGQVSPVHCRHLAELADNDDLIFTLVRSGAAYWTQKNLEANVTMGQGILTATGVAGAHIVHSPTRLLNLRFNREKIAARLSNADAALIQPVPADNQALRLLNNYVGVLSDEQMLADPALRLAMDDHLHDLVALVLGPTRDAREVAKYGGVRAARLRAIEQDIIANIARRDLSLDFIAARHSISPRYIRTLFDGAGTTFTDFVLGQRLMRAHRLLGEPRYIGLKISTIAFESGFGDLSYFNQRFRLRYGMAPSDIRAAARNASSIIETARR